jgi:hypothetical protein
MGVTMAGPNLKAAGKRRTETRIALFVIGAGAEITQRIFAEHKVALLPGAKAKHGFRTPEIQDGNSF